MKHSVDAARKDSSINTKNYPVSATKKLTAKESTIIQHMLEIMTL